MPKVFITGATGLLGGAVARAFVRHDYEIVCLARPGSPLHHIDDVPKKIIEGDLYNEDFLYDAMTGCDYLVHVAGAAGRFYVDSEYYEKSNVFTTENVYRAAKRLGIRRSVYTGTTGIAMRLKEEYGISKLRGAYAARREAGTDMEVIAVHPSGMTGPGDVRPTPLGRMIIWFGNGEIPVAIGGGVGFIHVDDAAEGHVAALEKGEPTRDYILSAEYLTFREVYSFLSNIFGVRVPFILPHPVTYALIRLLEPIYNAMKKEAPITSWTADFATLPPERHPDGEESREALGLTYRPVFDAFAEAVDWFRQNNYLSR